MCGLVLLFERQEWNAVVVFLSFLFKPELCKGFFLTGWLILSLTHTSASQMAVTETDTTPENKLLYYFYRFHVKELSLCPILLRTKCSSWRVVGGGGGGGGAIPTRDDHEYV